MVGGFGGPGKREAVASIDRECEKKWVVGCGMWGWLRWMGELRGLGFEFWVFGFWLGEGRGEERRWKWKWKWKGCVVGLDEDKRRDGSWVGG